MLTKSTKVSLSMSLFWKKKTYFGISIDINANKALTYAGGGVSGMSGMFIIFCFFFGMVEDEVGESFWTYIS